MDVFIREGGEGEPQVAVVDPRLVEWGLWRQTDRLKRVRAELDAVLANRDPKMLIGKTKRQLRRVLGEDYGKVTETLTVIRVLELADSVGFNPRMCLQDLFQALHESIGGDYSDETNRVWKFIRKLEDRLHLFERTEALIHTPLSPDHVIQLFEAKVLRKGDFSQISDLVELFGIDFTPYSSDLCLSEEVIASYRNVSQAVEEGVFDDVLQGIQQRWRGDMTDEEWEIALGDVLATFETQIRRSFQDDEGNVVEGDWGDIPGMVVSDAIEQLLFARYALEGDSAADEYRLKICEMTVFFMRRLWKRIQNTLLKGS